MAKKVQKKLGPKLRFKDLQPGDPLFMLNPYALDIEETMIFDVRKWDDPKNYTGNALEVIYYKMVTNIKNIDIAKLKEAEKELDSRVHQSLIVDKDAYFVTGMTTAISIPIPICTQKDTLQAWIRGERI